MATTQQQQIPCHVSENDLKLWQSKNKPVYVYIFFTFTCVAMVIIVFALIKGLLKNEVYNLYYYELELNNLQREIDEYDKVTEELYGDKGRLI